MGSSNNELGLVYTGRQELTERIYFANGQTAAAAQKNEYTIIRGS